VHRGEHEPILSRDLFEAVQAKRAANAVARQIRLRGSAALLAGRFFDDRGKRMSPTHTNKQGARYLNYVSHALLQNRKAEAGSIARVPAPEIESLVCDGVRRHLGSMAAAGPSTALADRDLIERHVARVIVTPQAVEVRLNPAGEESAQAEDPSEPRPGDGSRAFGSAALPPSPRPPNMKPRANGTSACSLPLPTVAPHHCGNLRWHSACGSHGHRSCEGPALIPGPSKSVEFGSTARSMPVPLIHRDAMA
jgi:hypothetical protein